MSKHYSHCESVHNDRELSSPHRGGEHPHNFQDTPSADPPIVVTTQYLPFTGITVARIKQQKSFSTCFPKYVV